MYDILVETCKQVPELKKNLTVKQINLLKKFRENSSGDQARMKKRLYTLKQNTGLGKSKWEYY